MYKLTITITISAVFLSLNTLFLTIILITYASLYFDEFFPHSEYKISIRRDVEATLYLITELCDVDDDCNYASRGWMLIGAPKEGFIKWNGHVRRFMIIVYSNPLRRKTLTWNKKLKLNNNRFYVSKPKITCVSRFGGNTIFRLVS